MRYPVISTLTFCGEAAALSPLVVANGGVSSGMSARLAKRADLGGALLRMRVMCAPLVCGGRCQVPYRHDFKPNERNWNGLQTAKCKYR